MFQPDKADGLICDYLEKCYTEPMSEIYSLINSKYEELVDIHGWDLINNVVNACSMHMCSEDAEIYRNAVSKIKKETIFDICSTVSFLAGMAYSEMEQKKI